MQASFFLHLYQIGSVRCFISLMRISIEVVVEIQACIVFFEKENHVMRELVSRHNVNNHFAS